MLISEGTNCLTNFPNIKDNQLWHFWETTVNGIVIKLHNSNRDSNLKQFLAIYQVIFAFMWIRFCTILKYVSILFEQFGYRYGESSIPVVHFSPRNVG